MPIQHDGLWKLPKGVKRQIVDTLYDLATGLPYDLTGITVKLKFKHPDTGVVTSVTATILDPIGGVVRFDTYDGTNISIFLTDDIDYQANVELSQGAMFLDFSNTFIIRIGDTVA